MTNFKLRGIAEGIIGKSEVMALNNGNLFNKYPQLKLIRKKLKISKGYVAGFSACDG